MAIPLEDAVYQAITTKHFYCRYRHQFLNNFIPNYQKACVQEDPRNKELLDNLRDMFPEWEIFDTAPVYYKRAFAKAITQTIIVKLKEDLNADRLDKEDSKRLYDDFKANEITWVEVDKLSEPRPIDQEKLDKAKEEYAEKLLQMIAGKSKESGASIPEMVKLAAPVFIRQNPKIAALLSIRSRPYNTKYDVEHNRYITWKGGLTVTHSGRGIKSTTAAFLLYLFAITGQKLQRELYIDVEDFRKARDMGSYEKAHDTVKDEIKSLYEAGFTFQSDLEDAISFRIINYIERSHKGQFRIRWDYDFFEMLKKSPGMFWDPVLLKADLKKFPDAIGIGFKLYYQRNINAGRVENILSAAALADTANLPDAEKNNDRHLEQRIISPIEKTLDHLCDIGFLKSWEYCGPKGRPLSKAELEGQGSWNTWKDLFIIFDLPENDQIATRRDTMQKRIAAKQKAKRRRIIAPIDETSSNKKRARRSGK